MREVCMRGEEREGQLEGEGLYIVFGSGPSEA